MRLAQFLKSSERTPKEFAAQIGVTAEAVRLYLTGQRIPREKTMNEIWRVTDGAVTANDFFRDFPEDGGPRTEPEVAA